MCASAYLYGSAVSFVRAVVPYLCSTSREQARIVPLERWLMATRYASTCLRTTIVRKA